MFMPLNCLPYRRIMRILQHAQHSANYLSYFCDKRQVFDEADMLFSGGFEIQVTRLLHLFRLEEKQASKTGLGEATSQSGQGETVFQILELQPWTDFQATEVDLEGDSIAEDTEASIWMENQDEECDSPLQEVDLLKTEQNQDWQRSRKHYQRSKQYIFVAATLPESGKKTPGAILKRFFPDAEWVNGVLLHCHNPR